MNTIAAPGVATSPSLPALKATAPAADGTRDADTTGQSAPARRGVGVHTPEYLARLAYIESPEYRERRAQWEAQAGLMQSSEEPRSFRTADEVAAYGEMATGRLKGLVDHVNTLLNSLNPEYLDGIRAFMGEEAAATVQAMRAEGLASSQRSLSHWEEEIRGTFAVSGTLVQRHDDGGLSLGTYTLSFSGAGFGVRLDSDGSVLVAPGGGSYQRREPGSESDGLREETAWSAANSGTARTSPVDLLA